MKYRPLTDDESDVALLSDSEVALQPQRDMPTHPHVAQDVPEPSKMPVSTPKKNVEDTAPGSEYWLP